MTNKEAISNLNRIYGMVAPDIQRSLDVAIKTLERPQGEWIGKEEYDDYPNKMVCECSECGKMICILHNDFPNFCPNCGAQMKTRTDAD